MPAEYRAVPKGLLRAFILAPLAVPIAYWMGALAIALADPARRHAALQAPFAGLGYVMVFGGLIAYGAMLVASWPAIWLVRRGTRGAAVALLAVGGLVGLVTALVLRPYLGSELVRVMLSPPAGAALGGLAGGVFWWLASRRPSRGPPEP